MKLQNRQQILTIAVIVLVAVFATDKMLITPLLKSWKARSARIVELQKKIKNGRLVVEREQNIRKRWDQMRANTLPDDSSMAEHQMLGAFDTWAQSSRISIVSMTPQWKRDSEDFSSLECRVDAVGSLAAISRFLYEVEKDPLGFKLESVELSARDTEGQQIALGLQISGLVLPVHMP